MPIQLTTPFKPGDLDPGKVYAEAKVVSFRAAIERRLIEIQVEYGNTVAGKWTPGVGGHRTFTIMDMPEVGGRDADGNAIVVTPASPDYTTMVAKFPTNGLSLYQGVAKELYAWLIGKGHLAGTMI